MKKHILNLVLMVIVSIPLLLINYRILNAQAAGGPISQIDTNFVFTSPRPLIVDDNIEHLRKHIVGFNLLLSRSGVGFGPLYGKFISKNYIFFSNLFFSTIKNTDELEYRTLDSNGYYILKVPNKIRRLYTLPLNIGMQRYISAGKLGNSFRPFVGAMAVPTLIWEMPYTQNWFNDVKYSRAHFRMGAGLQIGADFGAVNTTITTVKMQYIYTPFGGSGLESVIGSPIYNFGGFYISLGISY